MAEVVKTGTDAYDAPQITEIGSLSELTAGSGGALPDATPGGHS